MKYNKKNLLNIYELLKNDEPDDDASSNNGNCGGFDTSY